MKLVVASHERISIHFKIGRDPDQSAKWHELIRVSQACIMSSGIFSSIV